MRLLRLVWVGYVMQVKLRSRSAFDGALSVIWPLFFATTAFLVVRQSGDPDALVATAVGASVMGVWSSTSTTSASSMQQERRLGTLELLVAAPAPFALVMAPLTLAMATIGAYSMAATLVWGRVLFGIDVPIASPAVMAVAVPVTVASVGMLGFLLSMASVRYRNAWALGNATEYPVWLICGFLVPLSALPGWVRPISWALAPTWGVEAIRDASLGGSPWPDLARCVALGLAYAVVGAALARYMVRAAREQATLALS